MGDSEYKMYDSKRKANSIEGHDWGNKFVVNTGKNPVINFSFMIRIEGAMDLPCKAVRGFTKENDFDYIQEGGCNDYVHMRRKAISKPFTFQVDRYVGVDYIDPIPLGTELVLPVILFVNKYCFPTFKPVCNYAFFGCTVIGKTTGDLNAEQSGLFVETTTIAYRQMVCLKIPTETYDLDTWSIYSGSGDSKKFGGKKGNGTFNRLKAPSNSEYNASSNLIGEISKEEAIKRAKQWQKPDSEGKTHTYHKSMFSDDQIANDNEEKRAAKADENVYAINTGAGGKYKKSKQNHVTIDKVVSGSGVVKSKQDMEKAAKKYDPSKPLKPYKKGSTDYNGSANHSMETVTKTQAAAKAEERHYKLEDKKYKPKNASKDSRNSTFETKEKRKAAMVEEANKHMYVLNEANPDAHQGISSFESHDSKVMRGGEMYKAQTKEQMAQAAKQWPPTRSAKDVKDFLNS